jgi:hypothetical protein
MKCIVKSVQINIYLKILLLKLSKARRCFIANTFELCFGMCHSNQVGLKLNRTHQLLTYADDVNPLGANTDTLKRMQRL